MLSIQIIESVKDSEELKMSSWIIIQGKEIDESKSSKLAVL